MFDDPEIRGEARPARLKSKKFLEDLLGRKHISPQTIKDRKGKYGHFIGEVWPVKQQVEFET